MCLRWPACSPAIRPGRFPTRVCPIGPPDAWATVRREPRLLLIYLPAHGLRLLDVAKLGCGVIFLAFVSLWCAAAAILFINNPQQFWVNLFFAFVCLLGLLVALAFPGSILWMRCGKHIVMIDEWQLVTELRLLFWHRTRRIPRSEVQSARNEDVPDGEEGEHPYRYVEIVTSEGAFAIRCTGAADQAWLAAEINDFLKAVPCDPSGRDPKAGPTGTVEEPAAARGTPDTQ
jgi:hypothetical protein